MVIDNFEGKMIINLLSAWEPAYECNYFMSVLFDYMPPELRGEWHMDYLKLKKDHLTQRVEDGYDGHYVRYSSILTIDLIASWIAMMKEEFPILVEDWSISDKAKLLGPILELDRFETLILDFALRYSSLSYNMRQLLDQFKHHPLATIPVDGYSCLLGISKSDAKKALSGFLLNSGFLAPLNGHKSLHVLSDDMAPVFEKQLNSIEDVESQLFPSNMSTDLTPELYVDIAQEIAIAEDMINRASVEKTKGINLMFWGIPGTGKTELAIALAKKHGWDLKIIGDISDAQTTEKSRAQRLTSLKVGMKLFKNRPNVVLLFDEMEDLFKDSKNENFSKAFINRIIETTGIPIIWTTNDLKSLGSAVLRRMVYNIGFKVPGIKARRTIWQTYNAKYTLNLSAETLDKFSFDYDMVPALINNAAKIANLAKLPETDIPRVLKSLDTLVNYGFERKFDEVTQRKETPYDITCVNTGVNVSKLVDSLIDAEPGFSLCFYGPPGTGKSELGRHIAKRLGKRVLFKRASDLQSMWLGECEKNIAKAFHDAKENEMVLIIDEGDSFLRSRERAERSWEISQVNEMLSQMEMHDQPFVLTTNLMKELDQAALRRFTFKVAFDFIKPEQAARLFRAYFKADAPNAILRNHILTPGDFANVMKRARILKVTDTKEIYDMLEEECDLKDQKPKDIGFNLN